MASRRKKKCVRCESLERPQKSKEVHFIKTVSGEVPLCSACILEMREEELFLSILKEEEDEFGGESLD